MMARHSVGNVNTLSLRCSLSFRFEVENEMLEDGREYKRVVEHLILGGNHSTGGTASAQVVNFTH